MSKPKSRARIWFAIVWVLIMGVHIGYAPGLTTAGLAAVGVVHMFFTAPLIMAVPVLLVALMDVVTS